MNDSYYSFLKCLYKLTNGQPNAEVSYHSIVQELNISEKAIDQLVLELSSNSRGLIKTSLNSRKISLTTGGVAYVKQHQANEIIDYLEREVFAKRRKKLLRIISFPFNFLESLSNNRNNIEGIKEHIEVLTQYKKEDLRLLEKLIEVQIKVYNANRQDNKDFLTFLSLFCLLAGAVLFFRTSIAVLGVVIALAGVIASCVTPFSNEQLLTSIVNCEYCLSILSEAQALLDERQS